MFTVNLINQATKNETILVLNNFENAGKPAMLINPVGEQEELTCFERGASTQDWNSCSLNWQNQLFIFGGLNEKRQISRLSGYKLERVGDLLFDLYVGACSVMANQHIFLCFDWEDSKTCRHRSEVTYTT